MLCFHFESTFENTIYRLKIKLCAWTYTTYISGKINKSSTKEKTRIFISVMVILHFQIRWAQIKSILEYVNHVIS